MSPGIVHVGGRADPGATVTVNGDAGEGACPTAASASTCGTPARARWWCARRPRTASSSSSRARSRSVDGARALVLRAGQPEAGARPVQPARRVGARPARAAHGARLAQGLRGLDARRGRARGGAPPRAVPREEGRGGGRQPRPGRRPGRGRRPPPARVEEAKPGSPALVYGGIAAGVAVLGLLGVALLAARRAPGARRPRAARRHDHRQRAGGRDPGAPARDARAGRRRRRRRRPATTRPARPRPRPRRPRRSPTARATCPRPTLRGCAASPPGRATRSKLTVYNGTAWRVTELYVKISRFKDDDFVEDPRPVVLVPPGGRSTRASPTC